MISPVILVHFDPDLDIQLAVDASDKDLGAFLTHVYNDGTKRSAAYSPQDFDQNLRKKSYSQIDKEATTIIYWIKKCHQYLYGRKFRLLTDHKPLVSIFGPNKRIPIMNANISSNKNYGNCLARLPLHEFVNLSLNNHKRV